MSITSRRGEAGFSFVELLVAIFIAGVAFAAMVPLFVQAQDVQSADRMRTAAINLAQDKVERVRQLPWDLLDAGVLAANGADVAGQFGTSWTDDNGRKFSIQYKVVDSTGTDMLTEYKEVTVTVGWTAPPSPVKPAVLKTLVYKQYAGPQIVSLVFEPPPDARDWITDQNVTSIKMTAAINNAQAKYVAKVEFAIVDASGARQPVKIPLAGTPDSTTYVCTQDISTWSDGLYYVSVTATSAGNADSPGTPGNTVVRPLRLERQPPVAVQGLIAYDGAGVVALAWTPVNGAEYYEVYRADVSNGQLEGAPLAVKLTANSYFDRAVVNGQTYYYKVLAVDVNDRRMSLSDPTVDQVSGTPGSVSGTAPGQLTLNGLTRLTNNVTLTWGKSTEPGVVGYVVYRRVYDGLHNNGADSEVAAVVTSVDSPTWTDVGRPWNVDVSYTVRALNADVQESPDAKITSGVPKDAYGWAFCDMPETPYYQLKVKLIGTKVSNRTVNAYALDRDGTVIGLPITALTNVSGWADYAGTKMLAYGDYKITVTGSAKAIMYARLMGDPLKPVTVYIYL